MSEMFPDLAEPIPNTVSPTTHTWNKVDQDIVEHTYNIHHGRYLHVSWKSPLGLHIMGGQWSPRTTSFIPNDALISPETSKEDAIGDHWTLARNSE